jgi:hypothetical protein
MFPLPHPYLTSELEKHQEAEEAMASSNGWLFPVLLRETEVQRKELALAGLRSLSQHANKEKLQLRHRLQRGGLGPVRSI